jgi:regulator of replication initiation timing
MATDDYKEIALVTARENRISGLLKEIQQLKAENERLRFELERLRVMVYHLRL